MKNKLFLIANSLIVGAFIFALLVPTVSLGQSDKEKKEAKANQKDDKKTEKNIRKYQEALEKAEAKYQSNENFREDVDYEYRQLQRDHAKTAFEYNTWDSDDWVQTHSGDKLPRSTDTLYDNLMAQDYVNRVGQSLVPAQSEKRYGFKITVNPMPDARTLSTGTVYISSGLLSLVDNEAQLAYILGHEIAHIEKDHWKQDVLVAQWVEDETKSAEKKATIAGVAVGAVAGIFGGGGAVGKAQQMVGGALVGAALSRLLLKLVYRKAFEWSLAQEDEADRMSLGYMLERNYDVRESREFYDTLQAAAIEDPRIELDRFGDRKRAQERSSLIKTFLLQTDSSQLAKAQIGATNMRGKSLSLDRNLPVVMNRLAKNQEKMSDELLAKLKNGEIIAGDGEFDNVMSALKRDNGIVAFYYDMYKLAARNLKQSLAIRSDDSLGYYYYGKVLKLTARRPGEREQALQLFARAIELDKRNANPEARLYFALTKMSGRQTNNIQEVVSDLKEYVAQYQRVNGGALPPSINVIYDFMQEAGEVNWNATSFVNVGTLAGSTQAQTPAAVKAKP
ncbi:MAG: M48 family metalloprotease [Pyrinomonadaceae bacterium]|nr:M48 family metalloprotease [Pyrinomonadaceae bacterium]